MLQLAAPTVAATQWVVAAGQHVLAAPQQLAVVHQHLLAAPQQDKDTPGRILAMLGLLALVIVGWLAMWRGWRTRTRRQQSEVGPLPEVPVEARATSFAAVEGLYVGTTLAGRWLERVTAQGLGVRALATVSLSSAGVLVDRDGGQPLHIPAGDLHGVGRTSALAGKVVKDDGIVVMTWRHGAVSLDSGIYVRNEAERLRLLQGLEALVRPESEETT